MKSSIALAMAFVSVAAIGLVRTAEAQTPQPPKNPPTFVMTGNSFRQEGVVNHARGSVVVKTDALEILADEADFNAATGELEARGHVIVTPTVPPVVEVAPAVVKDTPGRPGLAQDLETARAMVARSNELFSKGLAPRAEVERAEAELNRLQAEAARELADKGLAPKVDVLRMPPRPDAVKEKAAGPGWTIQTDALKLKLPVGR